MKNINILMPSCQEPLSTSEFVLGGRLLEYLLSIKNAPEIPFISIQTDTYSTNIYLRSEPLENGSEGVFLYMFSTDSFCDNIKNEFFIEQYTVENLGRAVKDIYQELELNI